MIPVTVVKPVELSGAADSKDMIALHFRSVGEADEFGSDIALAKPLILCVHGNSQNAATFDPIMTLLGKTYTVVVLELPGHGHSDASSKPENVYSIPGYAKLVQSLLSGLPEQPIYLLGHSLGGHVVLEAAATLESVKAVVIFGAPPTNTTTLSEAFLPVSSMGAMFSETMPSEVRKNAASELLLGVPDHWQSQVLDNYDQTDPNARVQLGKSIQEGQFSDERALLQTMSTPVLCLHGSADPIVSSDYLHNVFKEAPPHHQLTVLQNVGHWPQLEQPELLCTSIQGFLSDNYAVGYS